ncbi:sensor histidine kinase [Longitalea luteola]|uniref:sensor histidine kinase n=1 Tax=Longitalea luteola TaxID=2812563 RepID=UPI001A967CDD|nr:histidine kinase [Longitalea luteola]
MKKLNREITFNLVFWLLYFLYEWFGLAALSGEYSSYLINACMALPLAFIVSYLTVHVFITKYYNHGKKAQFWILQIAVSLVLLLCRRLINYYIIYPAYFPQAQHVPLFSFGKLIVELVNLYVIVGVYALFYFVRSWYEERQKAQSLLQEKTVAELELLKSQVQPHFIFNALNNIYGTALKTSPETARLISHLSNLLDYNLYEAKYPFVSLVAEIAYVKHYVELQKNRYGSKLDVSVNIYDEISDLYIAPLLLLPLIENSFKHGIANAIRGGWIRVDVARAADHFSIKIENSMEEKAGLNDARNGGIGIKNVQTRLNLIYPQAHEFKIVKEPHSYLAVLKIKISK